LTTARQNVELFCYYEREYWAKTGARQQDIKAAVCPLQKVGAGTGMALGGWLGGLLFDVSGAYTWSIPAAG
jgi:hypothetical protein